jgi:hypothetical protein
MTPFKIFFADGCAATATWPNTITGTEQVNSDQWARAPPLIIIKYIELLFDY